MKKGDKYICTSSYSIEGIQYLEKNKIYTIWNVYTGQGVVDPMIYFDECDIFMWEREMPRHFILITKFKYGK